MLDTGYPKKALLCATILAAGGGSNFTRCRGNAPGCFRVGRSVEFH
jgi:hypothetical protein